MSRMQGQYRGKMLTKFETKDSKASYGIPPSGPSYQHSNITHQSAYKTMTSGTSHSSREPKDLTYMSNRPTYTETSMLSASSSNSQLIARNDVTKRLANEKVEAQKKCAISEQKNAVLLKENQKMKDEIKYLRDKNKQLKHLLENRNGSEFMTMSEQPALSQAKSIDSVEIVELNNILTQQQEKLDTHRSNVEPMVSKQTQTTDNWRIEAILKEKQKLEMENSSLKNDLQAFRHLQAISNSNARYVTQLQKMNASLKQEIQKMAELHQVQISRIQRIKVIVMEDSTKQEQYCPTNSQ